MNALLEPVLDWYAGAARDLPWRRPGTSPWAVMVSEFMLQQTPVNRVLPVYEAWLERWPTPGDLAAERLGEQALAAGDLIGMLPEAFGELRSPHLPGPPLPASPPSAGRGGRRPRLYVPLSPGGKGGRPGERG